MGIGKFEKKVQKVRQEQKFYKTTLVAFEKADYVKQMLLRRKDDAEKQKILKAFELMKDTAKIIQLECILPREKAQLLVYDGWEAKGSVRRDLAERALQIDPECADAYVLLGEDELTREVWAEAEGYFRKAMELSQKRLGQKFFEEHVGKFWKIIDTRPYMRGLRGLAEVLWKQERKQESIDSFKELLRLNPADDQGNHNRLSLYLLIENRNEELDELFEKYQEKTAARLYNKALVRFRLEGSSGKSRPTLAKAFNFNRYVPLYMLGYKQLPSALPKHINYGREDEAIVYTAVTYKCWAETEGALEWMLKQYQLEAGRQ